MKLSRAVLTIFALLDAVLLGRFLTSIYVRDIAGELRWCVFAMDAGRSLFLVSLAASSLGLAMERRWAMFLSYVQFPFRLLFALLSFGFLTLIPGLSSSAYGQMPVVIAAMVLEGVRLIVTIGLHVKSRRGDQSRARGVEAAS